MEIKLGYSYHLKDEFFLLVIDRYLMKNKENGAYRPHYYAVKDLSNENIHWMIPISSRFEKYEKIVDKKEAFDAANEILKFKKEGYSNKDIVKILKDNFNISKNEAYELVLNFENKEAN